MKYSIGTEIIIKEYFTEYEGKIVDFKNGVYEVEANGHAHFLTENEIKENISKMVKNQQKMEAQ